MHFFKSFFSHFFLNFFMEPFFWHSFEHFFWGLFQHFFIGLFWKPFLALLWVLFYGNELSLSPFWVLKNVTGLFCALFFGPPFNSFCFFYPSFQHAFENVSGGMNFFWQHLMSSKKCLNFFQTSFRSFSYHFLGTLSSCQEQLNRWLTATAT